MQKHGDTSVPTAHKKIFESCNSAQATTTHSGGSAKVTEGLAKPCKPRVRTLRRSVIVAWLCGAREMRIQARWVAVLLAFLTSPPWRFGSNVYEDWYKVCVSLNDQVAWCSKTPSWIFAMRTSSPSWSWGIRETATPHMKCFECCTLNARRSQLSRANIASTLFNFSFRCSSAGVRFSATGVNTFTSRRDGSLASSVCICLAIMAHPETLR